jgi:hypothetical protein
MTTRFLLATLCCVYLLSAAPGPAAEPNGLAQIAWFPKAPPLPKPRGQVIRVATVDQLFQAAGDVKPGGTILLADGHYMMPRYFELRTDNVTMRSASGDREKVVLDGARSQHGELVGITACSGVTVADLTIQNVKWNGLKLNSDKGVQAVTVYNCVIHNVWQRGVKGVRVPRSDPAVRPPANCRVQYCLFYNDRAKQFSDDPADTPQNFAGNYVGGIDVMYADRWTISDNVFVDIRGRTGEARGAIFLWHDSRDCRIERNVIVDCDSGICLGNSYRPAEIKVHCRRCVVRNNFVTRAPENGILADYTEDCVIAQNTIHDPVSRLKRLVRLVHQNPGLLVANNLLSGPPMRIETGSKVRFQGNVTRELTASFVSPQEGNLHLKGAVSGVVDAAGRLPQAPDDIDRQPRGDPCDVGADELLPVAHRKGP